MKDYIFKINVGDILRNSSKSDIIEFSQKFSTFLPQLIAPGISCIINVQGMDRRSLLVYIHDAKAHISGICDVCGKDFTGITTFPKKEVRCYFDGIVFEKEENTIYCEQKDTSIDLEEYITESFILEQGIVSLCQKCS